MSMASSGHQVAVTPNDDTDIPVTRGLYVGVSGDVAVVTEAGDEVTYVALAAGVVHPFRVKRVLEATTAESIIAVY